ncbi:hypothetical protein H7686_0000485 [Candidatus Phytoplasma asiaticum]|uniref:Effector n=1 Tax=Candidatus Phytoplasma asiaticum TaxID=2763338 RepID=A0AAX3B9P6_9MOLU|nr:hypothetical protein ['Parthenium hysterophorus' phyllody phytoplasma]UQV27300.1 hypothetical protein H7686_0000485 ['Parthenium hysterophorus' phyllody phytoplasma]
MFVLMIVGSVTTFVFFHPIRSSFMINDSKENLTSGNISSEVPQLENLMSSEEKNNYDVNHLPIKIDNKQETQDVEDYASIQDYNNDIFKELSNSEIESIIGKSENLEVQSVTKEDKKPTNIAKSKPKSKISLLFKPFRNIKKNLKKINQFNSTNNLVTHNLDSEPDYAFIKKNKNSEKNINSPIICPAIEFCQVMETPRAIV